MFMTDVLCTVCGDHVYLQLLGKTDPTNIESHFAIESGFWE